MPTNLFGSFDNFSTTTSHVLPALIRKFHDAKTNNSKNVILWGTGEPKRELMEVEEFARALMIVVNNYNDEETINIGTGQDLSIKEIAELVKEIVGFSGEIIWDKSKPDGTPRKLLDISKLKKLGYKDSQDLRTGIHKTYDWFKKELLQAQSAIRL
jgi:GDP-L-fucose synthase